MRKLTATLVASGLCLAAGHAAQAQSTGSSGMGQFQAGYNASRYTTAKATTGSTRDANGNRLVVNGLIQNGASSYNSTTTGVGSNAGTNANGTALGSSSAIGNSLNVIVQGNNNTVVVNSTQTNNGNIQAGTALNGKVNF